MWRGGLGGCFCVGLMGCDDAVVAFGLYEGAGEGVYLGWIVIRLFKCKRRETPT